ncbi:hypothetical protein [Paenibacillus pabuli]|uniref:hypothetical protein n=1 Tax=Paenibacillus pabuli TaxID=1472 RepID=UPI0015EC9E8B|nr:hypothetical protein [Paenibacillus pabuli]
MRHEGGVTQAYVYKEHQPTNNISKPTETIAVYNVDKEAELKEKDRLLSLEL